MRVFINPGHGGRDSGAVGFGITERDTVLTIGLELERLLKKSGNEVKLFQYDGLSEICTAANKYGADIFVSIHCNAFNGMARGMETWYYPTSRAGAAVALQVQSALVRMFPELIDRRIKSTSTFYVLRNTNAPAILVETAFIDNYNDNLVLRQRTKEFAWAIAQGLKVL